MTHISECWDVLGIAPTQNKMQIKRAYAKELKRHKPEQDSQGYQLLRKAFDQIMAELNRESTSKTLSDVTTTINQSPEQWAKQEVQRLWHFPEYDKVNELQRILQSRECASLFHKKALSEQLIIAASQQEWSVEQSSVFYSSAAQIFHWFDGVKIKSSQEAHVEHMIEDLHFYECLKWGSRQSWVQCHKKRVYFGKLLLGDGHFWMKRLIAFVGCRRGGVREIARLLQSSQLFQSMPPSQQASIEWWAR